jgi:Glycogen recognition site of AMP-activated protein kinase/Domain of unknown function (DUF3471)
MSHYQDRSQLITHYSSLITFLLICGFASPCLSQATSARKPNAEALRKYAGRYELEVGLIPISTLDVSLENDTLWIKPSLQKKRKLAHKSKTEFVDEIDGKHYTFARNEEGVIVSVTFEYEGGDYTAQKTVLPPPSLRGNTVFRLKGYPEATIVILSGSFNNWNQSQFVFGREGDEWICRIDLEPGRHTYKFIVDGNWLLDPANTDTEEDAAGNVNSVLVKKNE